MHKTAFKKFIHKFYKSHKFCLVRSWILCPIWTIPSNLTMMMTAIIFRLVSINQWHWIWDKVFKSEPSKLCGRQPFKSLRGYGPYSFNFLKAVFHKFYLVHSWILCPIIYYPNLGNIVLVDVELWYCNKVTWS